MLPWCTVGPLCASALWPSVACGVRCQLRGVMCQLGGSEMLLLIICLLVGEEEEKRDGDGSGRHCCEWKQQMISHHCEQEF